MSPAARVRGLRVELSNGSDVVSDVSFDIEPGEIVALVGESGSGKTTVSMAMLAFARRGARISGGSVEIGGENLLALDASGMRSARGRLVAYVPQDPAAALNPALRVRRQLTEQIQAHVQGVSKEELERRVTVTLDAVGLSEDSLAKYPHQMSGGQQQRVGIAMAGLLTPGVLVLDEPTTGLDVTTQARILTLLRSLCTEHRIGALYVTHDLSVVSEVADRVIVMYAGRVVEVGTVAEIFAAPRHPYTRALLGSIPHIERRNQLVVVPGESAPPGSRPAGCAFHPRCSEATAVCSSGGEPPIVETAGHSVRCHHAGDRRLLELTSTREAKAEQSDRTPVLEVEGLSAGYGHREVLRGVDFSLFEGECLAVVGESGSGKSTLSRCLIGLHAQQSGTVRFRGNVLPLAVRDRSKSVRQSIQYVFQSPYNSLNPRKTVGQTIHDAFSTFHGRGGGSDARVREALASVGLAARLADALPDELSGGERQRAAIARALVCDPDILVCDEVTSALDVSVQASVLELLEQLREDRGLTLLFVTHNLAVVRSIADRVLVLDHGKAVEVGEVATVFASPSHPYTQTLLSNTPSVDHTERKAGQHSYFEDQESSPITML